MMDDLIKVKKKKKLQKEDKQYIEAKNNPYSKNRGKKILMKTTNYEEDLHYGYKSLEVVWNVIVKQEIKSVNELFVIKRNVFSLQICKTVRFTSGLINTACREYMEARNISHVRTGENKAFIYPVKNLKKFIKKFLKQLENDIY